MKISKKQTKHIAELSALELATGEIDLFSNQLSKILDFVAKLNEVDTKKTAPLFQVTDLVSVWRKDKVVPSKIKREEFLKIAPKKQNNFFATKKIFERE